LTTIIATDTAAAAEGGKKVAAVVECGNGKSFTFFSPASRSHLK